jgi:phage/conjugal plasmid C-4 type zinc finger TraR family protein
MPIAHTAASRPNIAVYPRALAAGLAEAARIPPGDKFRLSNSTARRWQVSSSSRSSKLAGLERLLMGLIGRHHSGIGYNSAAISEERRMATGWAAEGAVQDQIDATVKDGINRAKSRLPQGPSLTHCAECGSEIPEARRLAVAGVRLCVSCQDANDREVAQGSGYNRRGSKDSQLR